MESAVVVLSGGQDSATCLYWAKRMFEDLFPITFNYNQRHKSEIAAAQEIAERAVGRWELVTIEGMTPSALAPDQHGGRVEVSPTHGYLGLPSTFTPARNALFLVHAAMHAYRHGAHHIVTGVCQTDYSGYPDCRRVFVDALQQALVLGMEWPLQIHTPLMWLTKAQTVNLAAEMGEEAWEALSRTITCYHGTVGGCGECPACKIRALGFQGAGYEDPAIVPSKFPKRRKSDVALT